MNKKQWNKFIRYIQSNYLENVGDNYKTWKTIYYIKYNGVQLWISKVEGYRLYLEFKDNKLVHKEYQYFKDNPGISSNYLSREEYHKALSSYYLKKELDKLINS